MGGSPDRREEGHEHQQDEAHEEELKQNLQEAIDSMNEVDIASDLKKILDEF